MRGFESESVALSFSREIVRRLTLSITSIRVWAFSSETCPGTPAWSSSKKIAAIRGMRSRVAGASPIRCPQTERVRTCKATSEVLGREMGLGSQQRCVKFHKSSVKVGCIGRGGRLPCVMENIAVTDGQPLNGTAPVKIYIGTERQ